MLAKLILYSLLTQFNLHPRNVVFTIGHYVEGDTVYMYYGASDEVICGATFSINEILQTLTF